MVDAQLDQLDAGRNIWVDMGWRGLQVFIASLLVDVSGTDFISAAKNVKFWEDALGAAITAMMTVLLALASSRAGIPAPARQAEPVKLAGPGELHHEQEAPGSGT